MASFFDIFKKKDNQPKDAFFLSPDDSKTYGDIDYMRTAKTVRRTFVKTVGNPEGGEVVSQVSSNKMTQSGGNVAKTITPKTTSSTFSTTFQSTPAPVAETTPAPAAETTPTPAAETTPAPKAKTAPAPVVDDSMDMFRSMAKKIRK